MAAWPGSTPLARRAAEARSSKFFSEVAFEGAPTQRQVRVLLEDRAGRVWAGGRGGLSVLDRSAASSQRSGPSCRVLRRWSRRSVERVDGSLWIGTLAASSIAGHPATCWPRLPLRALACGTYARWSWTTMAGSGWAMTRDCSCSAPVAEASADRVIDDRAPARLRHRRAASCRRLRLPTRRRRRVRPHAADGLIDPRVRALWRLDPMDTCASRRSPD